MNGSPPEHHLLGGLADQAYIQERISPKPGETFYFHLSDLLLALKPHASDLKLRILDFGCGGSPYRSLFPNAEYFRADLGGVADVNFSIGDDGRTNAPADNFDVVLSTQVLEHCPSPDIYLEECRRVLRPGGRLILSTHGLFEEHGCPYDFQRWTEDGLKRLVEAHRLRVSSIKRVTSGPRAGLMLFQRSLVPVTEISAGPMTRLLWKFARRLVLTRRPLWDPLFDHLFQSYRVSNDQRIPGDALYIALLAVAEAV